MEHSRQMRQAAGYTNPLGAGVGDFTLALGYVRDRRQQPSTVEVEAVCQFLKSKLLELTHTVLELQNGR